MPIADLPGIGAMMRTSGVASAYAMSLERLSTLFTFVPDATATSYIVTVGPRWAAITRIHPERRERMAERLHDVLLVHAVVRRRRCGAEKVERGEPVGAVGRRDRADLGPRRGHGGALVVGRTRRIERADGLRLRQHDDGLGEPQPLELALGRLGAQGAGGPSLHPVLPRPSRRRAHP